jgi:DNA-directed RNA polymerase
LFTYTEADYDRQVELEKSMRTNGIARYRRLVAKAQKNRDESSIRTVSTMLQEALEATAVAVKAFYDEADSGKAGKRSTAYPLMKGLEPEVIAFLTAKVALDGISRQRSLQSVAKQVGRAMEDELWFRAFDEQKPHLWRSITQSLMDEMVGSKQRQSKLRRSVDRYSIDVEPWSAEQVHFVGMKGLELLIDTTGMFEIVTYNQGATQKVTVFKAKPETLKWIMGADAACEVMSPVYTPMVVPPADWTTPFDGGYISNTVRRAPLVQTRNAAYLEELANHEMPAVYAAVNAIQRTPWRVNSAILDVVRVLWQAESEVGGLPSPRSEEVPPFPADKEDKEAVQAWKRESCLVHQGNGKRRSRRILCGKAIFVAEQFKTEAAIYFPQYCDFRGRIYPRPLSSTRRAPTTPRPSSSSPRASLSGSRGRRGSPSTAPTASASTRPRSTTASGGSRSTRMTSWRAPPTP